MHTHSHSQYHKPTQSHVLSHSCTQALSQSYTLCLIREHLNRSSNYGLISYNTQTEVSEGDGIFLSKLFLKAPISEQKFFEGRKFEIQVKSESGLTF